MPVGFDGLQRIRHLVRSVIAFLSGRRPVAGVYFVCPLASASVAAFLMWSGVSKSGSPAEKEMTSIPCSFIWLAFAVIASVTDSSTSLARRERMRFFVAVVIGWLV